MEKQQNNWTKRSIPYSPRILGLLSLSLTNALLYRNDDRKTGWVFTADR